MNLSVAQLETHGYVLVDKLDHQELVPFIQTYMKKRTFYSTFYIIANLFLLGMIAGIMGWRSQQPDFHFERGFSFLSYGIAMAFALVPLHEFIHVLAYKSQGAQHTSYDANLRKFIFMAVADQFVANRKEFTIVALAPFVVISIALLVALPFAGVYWQLTILGILFTHTACCSGDFGILSYFRFHKDRDIVTYDDRVNKVSYFYGR
jgi:hypothetical protein